MEQFQVNKWIRVTLSILIAGIGAMIAYAIKYDWRTVVNPDTAAIIVSVLGLIKTAYGVFAPSPGKSTEPTGGTIVTSKAVPTLPHPPVAS